jgi:hypothetical protein
MPKSLSTPLKLHLDNHELLEARAGGADWEQRVALNRAEQR